MSHNGTAILKPTNPHRCPCLLPHGRAPPATRPTPRAACPAPAASCTALPSPPTPLPTFAIALSYTCHAPHTFCNLSCTRSFLYRFASKVPASYTTADVCYRIIKPITEAVECRLTDLMRPQDVRAPHYFISHRCDCDWGVEGTWVPHVQFNLTCLPCKAPSLEQMELQVPKPLGHEVREALLQ